MNEPGRNYASGKYWFPREKKKYLGGANHGELQDNSNSVLVRAKGKFPRKSVEMRGKTRRHRRLQCSAVFEVEKLDVQIQKTCKCTKVNHVKTKIFVCRC